MRISQNSMAYNPRSLVMYVDMNSFFASCEQQENEALRGKPIGVITHPSEYACVIAPSVEAKVYKVKTGMRLPDCRVLCPQMIPVLARPYIYRQYHMKIMEVLNRYCNDIIARSIDEAVMNLTSYQMVYPDPMELARSIKADLALTCGQFVKCSIGIAPNAFLAKLATEIQKPDGLVRITPENIDSYLEKMQLTDLPGIARANEKRLHMIGIKTPLQMRHSSEALLRRAFGGVVGNYWHRRLHFMETDIYQNDYKGMSATRTVSRQQRQNPQALESLFISLCTRLEQRMVKQKAFCKEINFYVRYHDMPAWDVKIHLNQPTQDALEMRRYIEHRIEVFEKERKYKLFNTSVSGMGVSIANFVKGERVQYGLFDNKINQDKARAVLYEIKDMYNKNIVRKASETVQPHEMRDAIGFGSVKDLYIADGVTDRSTNQYLLQDDSPEGDKNKLTPKQAKELARQNNKQPAKPKQNTLVWANEDDKYYYPPNDDKWEGVDIMGDAQTDFAA
jgi:DNA polymerase IV